MASLRIVYSAAPADAPETDLHIWSPPHESALFTDKRRISDALAEFMGLPAGSEATLSEINRFLLTYVKENNLLTGQKINADTKLSTLFGVEPTTDLRILNLMQFMRKHIAPRLQAPFNSWWTERGQPLWVGINRDSFHTSQFDSIYQLLKVFKDAAYKNLTVVVYADVQWNDAEGEAPCGCMNSPCEYHYAGEDPVAACGCSDEYVIKCPYHAELTAGAE
jgi:hypothetical protein